MPILKKRATSAPAALPSSCEPGSKPAQTRAPRKLALPVRAYRASRAKRVPVLAVPTGAYPPSLALLPAEPLRTLLHLARGTTTKHSRAYAQVPRGDGQPVLVLPGLATQANATALLRRHLNMQGYNARDWGLGWNLGPRTPDIESWLAPLVALVSALSLEHGKPVALVGWSLGGIAAREVAKRVPEHVSLVVTLASPFADAYSTHAGKTFSVLTGRDLQDYAYVVRQLAEEPPVAGVSVYSRTDGLVHWKACVQAGAQHTEHVEVNHVSHGGMVFSPAVIRVVLRALAAVVPRRRADTPALG